MVVVANRDPNRAIGSEFERVLNKVHEDELEPTLIANDRLNCLVTQLPVFEVNLLLPFWREEYLWSVATFSLFYLYERSTVKGYLDGGSLYLCLRKEDVSYEVSDFLGWEGVPLEPQLALVYLFEVEHLFHEWVDEVEHVDAQLTVIDWFFKAGPDLVCNLLQAVDDQRHEHYDRVDGRA